MNQKSFAKRVMALALCLIMVLGVMPMTAFAAGYGDKGYDTSHQATYVIDGNSVFVYTTGNGGTVTRISGGDDDSVQQYRATADENWEFAYWSTYYVGPSTQASNTTAALGYYYFSVPGDEDTPYNKTNAVIQINEEVWAQGVYYLQAIFEPKVTVSVNDPTNTFTKGIWGYSPATTLDDVFFSGTTESVSGYVPYGATIKVRVSAFSEQYAVESVTVHDGSSRNDFTYEINAEGSFMDVNCTAIKRPTNVTIGVKIKEQIITFDANGGTGNMAAQSFDYGIAQSLSANSFTRTGYTFAGWNTEENGSGTGYANGQSVSFSPVNDGDSIILYAQWTQCTNHQWTDGECTECGALCSHSGGNATCTDQATCSTCGEKYGELAKHNVVYSNSNNRIVETCTAGCGHTATADLVRDENVSTVYNGAEIKALKVSYSDNWQGGDLNIVYSNNVTVGIASGTISIGGATATQTFGITAATMTNVSAPGYNGVYDGQAHGITVNAPAGTTVSYKVGNGEYSAENPTFKNAGIYTVSYKVSMANYADVEGTADINISKAPLTVTANNHSIKYGEDPANSGVTFSNFVANENEDVLGGTLAYNYSYNQYGNVGDYDIAVSGLTSDNYEITYVKGTLTVEQKEIGINWSNTSLTYKGEAQKPTATATGVVNGDQIVLTVDGAKTNASDTAYTATVTGIGGEKSGNYKLPASVTTEFTIGKATPDLGVVSAEGVVKDTTKPENVVLVRTNETVPGKLRIVKFVGEFMRADKSDYDWEFVPDDMDNYNVVNGSVQIDVKDTVAPTASISVDEHKWTVWDTITFGLFYNESKEVTITAADNENGSGIKEIVYFIANRDYEADELRVVEWKSYTEAFDIDPDGKYVVYAKITDNDGNTVIINSDGLVLDKTQAVVEGLTNGGTYYGRLEFTVADELAGVKSVVIDGNDETNSEGQYAISPDNAEHTVVVTDNAGNATEYKVTVYKNYTVTYTADGETVSTETVGHGKDATLPAVPAKAGYIGKWDHDGKNITSDIVINAVYTENSAPAPSDPQSPQTGDNSHMMLWIALLFISGGAVITLTVVDRKRRTASKR